MGAVPGETLTFLFTDIEGSTRRWEAEAVQMAEDLEHHDEAIRAAVETSGGSVFKTTGDGICAVFPVAYSAVQAAVAAQSSLELPVRMGVHSGEAQQRAADYFGPTLNRCARLMETAHGGQVVVSSTTAALIAETVGPELQLRDLGAHRLRDLHQAERIFQVVAPALPDDFPPLRSLDVVRHNLPVQRSSFVGREDQLTEIAELLVRSRLVTLTGVGGCGKTRLALEVAAKEAEYYADGVFFVDLAPLADDALLTQTIASALGLHLAQAGVSELAAYLADRGALVVLDNCEHLVDACAALVDAILTTGDAVKILATSREALGVEGERAFPVPSLDVETEGSGLFLNRALAARPGLSMTADLEATAAEICRRLDGMPLAIELAAARAAHLAPSEILTRLSDRFRLLTGGRRRVQRQQTLQAAIDWSHDLLREDERVLLRRLSVFSGSFSLAAAEAICHPDALDLLGSLVAKSLVALSDDAHATRYRLLETVRIYAEEKLFEAGEGEVVRAAHRDWFLAWLESIPMDELIWTEDVVQLLPEADNLQTALEWTRQEGSVALLSRMATRMIGYWFHFVRVADLATWSNYLLAESEGDAELRAAALVAAAFHGMAAGDFVAMEALSGEAAARAAPGSWTSALAWSLQTLYWSIADPERGTNCAEEGARAAAEAATRGIGAMTMTFSAQVAITQGDLRRAASILQAAASAHPAHVMDNGQIVVLALLGDVDEAKRLLNAAEGSTPVFRHLHEFAGAMVALADGRRDDAVRHLGGVMDMVRDHALPLADVDCVLGFAALATSDEDFERASRLLASARAAAPFPFRTASSVAVYRQYVRIARDHLDRATLDRCRADAATTPVASALATELARTRLDPMT